MKRQRSNREDHQVPMIMPGEEHVAEDGERWRRARGYAVSDRSHVWSYRLRRLLPGCVNAGGYVVFNKTTRAKLVAEAFVPRPVVAATKLEVDHINRVRTADVPSNLRWVDRYSQARNRTAWGKHGRAVRPKGNRWCARIRIFHKLYHLGTHATQHEAAYAVACRMIECGLYDPLPEDIVEVLAEEERLQGQAVCTN